MAIGVELAAVGVELIPGIAGADNLTVGTSTITGGANGRILYNNSGILGERATSGASSVVLRDSNQNVTFNNHFDNATSTVSAGGTTVLTAASSRNQALTGSSSQTYQLPDATTLQIGPTFSLNNNSSGSLVVTNAGGSTLYTVPAGGIVQCGPTNIGSSNGTWDFHPLPPATVTWGSGTTGLVLNSALSTTPAITAGTPSGTSPVFIPRRSASTTGIGAQADGNLSLIVAGAEITRVVAGGPVILPSTAIPAGGTAGSGYKFSSTSNFGIFFGSGAPTLSAGKGSLYLRSDGSTTNDRAYINTDGSTTWTALTTAG